MKCGMLDVGAVTQYQNTNTSNSMFLLCFFYVSFHCKTLSLVIIINSINPIDNKFYILVQCLRRHFIKSNLLANILVHHIPQQSTAALKFPDGFYCVFSLPSDLALTYPTYCGCEIDGIILLESLILLLKVIST